MIYLNYIENDIEVNFTSMIVSFFSFFFYTESRWSYNFTFWCLGILRLALGISWKRLSFTLYGRIDDEGPQNSMSICLVFREFDENSKNMVMR